MLPFKYQTFAVVSFAEEVINHSFFSVMKGFEGTWPHEEKIDDLIRREVQHYKTSSLVDTLPPEDELTSAIAFSRKLRQVYALFTPEEQLIKRVLENPNYFPDSRQDFKNATGGYHQNYSSLFRFWRGYSQHFHAYRALEALGKLYGSQASEPESQEGTPIVWHLEMPFPDDPVLAAIVATFRSAEKQLTFTPALPVYSLIDYVEQWTLRLRKESNGKMVSVLHTLAGEIVFGLPPQELLDVEHGAQGETTHDQ